MPASYPTSIKSFTNPTSSDKLNSPSHSTQHIDENAEITAIENYVGTNASQTTPGASGRVLRSTSSTASTWGQAVLTTDVTGTLPVANGGSGATTLTGIVKGNGTSAFTAVTAPSGTIVGDTDTQTLTNKTLTSPTLTTPSAFTTGGSITLAENTTIALDPAGSTDGKYTGITVTGTAGYAQTFGDLVYLDPTDSRWEKADANSASGADGDARGIIGIVVVAGAADGNACTILLEGIVRADAAFPTFTINNPIYVSETAGAVTQTQPTTTDVVIRIIGAALTADEMFFRPDFSWTTHI